MSAFYGRWQHFMRKVIERFFGYDLEAKIASGVEAKYAQQLLGFTSLKTH